MAFLVPTEVVRRPVARSKIININPGNMVFIDDNPQNLTPARKLGMQTILAGSDIDLAADIADLISN